MESPLLKDPKIRPTAEVLKATLGKSYSAYEYLMEIAQSPEFALVPEWKYYNDGKVWLCKVCGKKKTVFWLSVWDKSFKVGFYFTEKHRADIEALKIDPKLIEVFRTCKPIGRILPLVVDIKSKRSLADIPKLIAYKKSLK